MIELPEVIEDGMTPTRIEPDRNNHNLRTFECSECEFVYKLMADDQVKSVKT